MGSNTFRWKNVYSDFFRTELDALVIDENFIVSNLGFVSFEDTNLITTGTIEGGGFKLSDGSIGLTKTVTIMKDGGGLCTMTFKGGLLTATTCP